MSANAATDPIAREAIAWAVRLADGNVSAIDRAAYDDWRRADPRHEAAASRLEHSLGLFTALPAATEVRSGARRALLEPVRRRRLLRDTLGLGLLAVGGGFALHRHRPVPQLLADIATGTAERRELTLADGSRLWLNARSAVDLDFSPTRRQLRLRGGELIVDVAPDASRPFVVHSAEGSVRALGTRFLVRQGDGYTQVSVLHSAVRVEPGQGKAATLTEGHSARFDRAGVHADTTPPTNASAWQDGFIEVHDRPLQEIVATLRAYRPGLLRISPAAGRLRVTGSFPLDDSERTLAALAEALPIAVQRHTRYWVSIDLR